MGEIVPSVRVTHLEAMRGIAALVVVANHLVFAFNQPAISSADPNEFWYGMPWFMFFNGNGAVNFFFVLSGYVLALNSLQSGNAIGIGRNAIKRWPRLAGPVL